MELVLEPVQMGSQVPLMLTSPNIEAKLQPFESQETIKLWFIFIKVGS